MTESGLIEITNDNMFNVDMFCIPDHFQPYIKNILIPHGLILDRVEKLAQQIVHDMKKFDNLVALCVLKGGHQFYSDLLNAVKKQQASMLGSSVQLTLEFVRVSSYSNMESTGEVTIEGMNPESLRGKNVLICEDLIDTGLTMTKLLKHLQTFDVANLKVASLMVKRSERSNKYMPDYVGFSIPDHFVVGAGMDVNGKCRDINHLCVLNDEGIKHFTSK